LSLPPGRWRHEPPGAGSLTLKNLPKAEGRLAALQKIWENCEEYSELKEKIADYRTKQQSCAISHFESSVT
jgi:hypothetical protein